MPLPPFPAGLNTLIASADYEFQASLDAELGSGDVIHISTAPLIGVDTIDYGVIDYIDDLRETSQLSEALTLAVNRLDLRAQNVDGVLGGLVLGSASALNGAQAILSIIYIDDDDVKYQVEVMHGELVNASALAPNISFQLVSHLSTDGAVGGWRTLQNACTHRYKQAGCRSLSTLPTCSKDLDGTNGCIVHISAARITTPAEGDNRSSFGGFPFQKEPAPGTPAALIPGGRVDGGDDFNSYWRERQALGSYTGRYDVPAYLL